MANEFEARFLVQRDDKQFVCRGKDLYAKVKDTDIFAIQRGDTLYHGTKDKIRDSDWLVCSHKNTAKRAEGSQVIPLLLPPPSVEPLVIKVNGTVIDHDTAIELPPGAEVQLEVITNAEADNLTKSYVWVDRNEGSGSFLSSKYARAVAYEVGPVGTFAVLSVQVDCPGAETPMVSSQPIQIASVETSE